MLTLMQERTHGRRVYFEEVEIHPVRITVSFVADGAASLPDVSENDYTSSNSSNEAQALQSFRSPSLVSSMDNPESQLDDGDSFHNGNLLDRSNKVIGQEPSHSRNSNSLGEKDSAQNSRSMHRGPRVSTSNRLRNSNPLAPSILVVWVQG